MTYKINWWILVSNGNTARIIETPTIQKNQSFSINKTFFCDDSRKYEQDLSTDKPGKVKESANTAHHSYIAENSLHKLAKRHFASIISSYLNDNATKNNFQKLIIITSPEFLGELRSGLSNQCNKKIANEIAKDLTKLDDTEIIDYVFRHNQVL